MNKNKHEPDLNSMRMFSYICKYCNCDIVYDGISNEYIGYVLFDECISDEEKIIKDLLE